MTYFLSLGSKITVDKDCSHKIKRHLLLGRKVTTNLDSVVKSRDITLWLRSVKSRLWFFQQSCMDVSWTIKKAENWRTDTFELWCWRRLLRVPWTARNSNQSILKEIKPEYSWKDWCWSWSSSTLATWCKKLTHWKRPWCWERLKAKEEGDSRGWDS